jgi:hypothetical protein
MVDWGWLREYHLYPDWKDKSKKEEKMSFENLVFILKNYIKNGYKNIIVTDLPEPYVEQISKIFKKYKCIIFTLYLDDEEELKKRVLTETRDSGYRDFKTAILINRKIKLRKPFKNETIINNTHRSPEKTVKTIIKLLKK